MKYRYVFAWIFLTCLVIYSICLNCNPNKTYIEKGVYLHTNIGIYKVIKNIKVDTLPEICEYYKTSIGMVYYCHNLLEEKIEEKIVKLITSSDYFLSTKEQQEKKQLYQYIKKVS